MTKINIKTQSNVPKLNNSNKPETKENIKAGGNEQKRESWSKQMGNRKHG